MPHQKGSHMTGPIRSTVGGGGSKVVGRSGSITIATIAAAAEAVYTIADADAEVNDVICVSPQAAPEAGVVIASCYCIVAGVVSITIRNAKASGALTGGALAVSYSISR